MEGPGAEIAGGAGPLAADEIRRRAAELLASGDYQTDLPRARVPFKLDLDLPLGPLEVLLRILFWAGLAVLFFLVVSWLVRRLSGPPADPEVVPLGAAAPVAIPIASAEALAAEGRWAEAIHALLLETLEALSRAARLAPSLTSREIVARVRLPVRAREALSGLVLAVEVSRFGGAAAEERDYRECLGRFHAFLDTYRGAA